MNSSQFICEPVAADRWAIELNRDGYNVEKFTESQAAINFVERHLGPISGENPTYFGNNYGGILERDGVCASFDIWKGQQWSSRQPENLCWCGLLLIPNPKLWTSLSQRKFLSATTERLVAIGFKPIDGQDDLASVENEKSSTRA